MIRKVYYRDGYKYQLVKDYCVQVEVFPPSSIATRFTDLSTTGLLLIRAGYAWDGASGPAIDTKNFMRGSLVHDALYQLMREGELDGCRWQKQADIELRRIVREDGMSAVRAWWVYWAVRTFAARQTQSSSCRLEMCAP